jgi:hypothetical protein
VFRHRRAARAAALTGLALAPLAALACGGSEDADAGVVRGKGLQPAALPPAAEAQLYEAALRAAFELEPALSLLLHPRRLPRTAGQEGGAPVPAAVVSALRSRRAIRGTCEPPADSSREAPRCAAEAPGYLVRGSEPFRVAGDTVELHLAAERYSTAAGDKQEVLAFERIYRLAGSAGRWRVAGEARAPEATTAPAAEGAAK